MLAHAIRLLCAKDRNVRCLSALNDEVEKMVCDIELQWIALSADTPPPWRGNSLLVEAIFLKSFKENT